MTNKQLKKKKTFNIFNPAIVIRNIAVIIIQQNENAVV